MYGRHIKDQSHRHLKTQLKLSTKNDNGATGTLYSSGTTHESGKSHVLGKKTRVLKENWEGMKCLKKAKETKI